MRYHVPLLCLLAIAESVCADSGLEYSPFPKPALKAGVMPPQNSDSNTGAFTPFPVRIPQTPSLNKRQAGTCPASGMHLCTSGKCCPNGYDCQSNGVSDYCCPTGQTCTGPGSCMAGTTDCSTVNGGDGCCPTATTFCDRDSTGRYGCREITGSSSSSSGSCADAGYYPCADLSGCCKTGTTCITGTNYCQQPCDAGYSECYGGCCPSGYTCDSLSQNCKKSSGLSYTTRTSTSSPYVVQTSTTPTQRTSSVPQMTPLDTETTPFPTFNSETPTTTTSALSTRTAATTNSAATASLQTAIATGSSSASGLRIPVLFGLVVIGLCALVEL